jgi:hypothetical protein
MLRCLRLVALLIVLGVGQALPRSAWAEAETSETKAPEAREKVPDAIYTDTGYIIDEPKNAVTPPALQTETTLSIAQQAARDFREEYGRAPKPDELRELMANLPAAAPGSRRALVDQAMLEAGAAAQDALNRGETINPGSNIAPNKGIEQLVHEAARGQDSSDIAYTAYQDSLAQIQHGDEDSCKQALDTLNKMMIFFKDAETGKKAAQALNARCGKDFAPPS